MSAVFEVISTYVKESHSVHTYSYYLLFKPLRAVGVLFSPMVSGWAGGHWLGVVGVQCHSVTLI